MIRGLLIKHIVSNITFLSVILAVCSCTDRQHGPTVDVKGGNLPQFILSNKRSLAELLVYRVPPELLDKPIPDSLLTKDNADVVWWIKGEPQEDGPITFGIVPDGMREIVPVKPLIEDQQYFLLDSGTVGGGITWTWFVIHNGKAERVK